MNKYQREIKPGVIVDVYDVLSAYGVTCSAMAHAIKKCLAPGQRGVKDATQDKEEAIASIKRSIEMEAPPLPSLQGCWPTEAMMDAGDEFLVKNKVQIPMGSGKIFKAMLDAHDRKSIAPTHDMGLAGNAYLPAGVESHDLFTTMMKASPINMNIHGQESDTYGDLPG